MISDYVREIHQALQERQENVILVHESMLTKDDENLVKQLEVEYHKTIKFCSLQEIISCKNKNVYIVL